MTLLRLRGEKPLLTIVVQQSANGSARARGPSEEREVPLSLGWRLLLELLFDSAVE